jgi:nucleoside-diphosphate-sugar epimerase
LGREATRVRVLIIGGTRFVGYQLAWRLVLRGDRVTLLNRGTHPDPFGERVDRILADRRGPGLPAALAGRTFDAAVDFAAYDAQDAESAVDALAGRIGHYIFISSGQVYLVLEGARRPAVRPAPEVGYHGLLMEAPAESRDLAEWRYGVGKRAAEDLLAEAHREHGFPATRLRLPMVNGERDPDRRIEGYLRRILDGGPLLLPDGGSHPVRHVYATEVARAIAGMLGREDTFGEVYNLAQDEMPSLRTFLELLASLVGAVPDLVDVPRSAMHAAGLRPEWASAFSDPWMSCLDPSLAKVKLSFSHEPLQTYLGKIVAAYLAAIPESPPENYLQRPEELALVR